MREVRYLKIPDPVAIFAYDPSTEKVLCTFYFGNRLAAYAGHLLRVVRAHGPWQAVDKIKRTHYLVGT